MSRDRKKPVDLGAALVEAFLTNEQINQKLLDLLDPKVWDGSPPCSKRRNIATSFAHMHNVRLMWLKSAAPELLAGVEKIEGADGTREDLRAALEASGGAVESLLRASLPGGRVKGFRPHAVAFLGYLISHESHHRGQMTITLRQLGQPLEDRIDYGMWEWGVR